MKTAMYILFGLVIIVAAYLVMKKLYDNAAAKANSTTDTANTIAAINKLAVKPTLTATGQLTNIDAVTGLKIVAAPVRKL